MFLAYGALLRRKGPFSYVRQYGDLPSRGTGDDFESYSPTFEPVRQSILGESLAELLLAFRYLQMRARLAA